MDSLTQITLGAAVGEAVLGKQVGNKAMAWGALAGLLPDLDILTYPWLDEAARLVVHRGFTHGLLFPFLAAPVLGFLAHRLHRHPEAGMQDWTRLAFWGILTHPLLDVFTVYGTGLFEPFSSYRVALNSIFIIDPLYTVPLLIGVVVAGWRSRGSPGRQRAIRWGLGLSTLYLFSTLASKTAADAAFTRSLEAQGVTYTRFMSAPTPLNSVLWRAVVEDEAGYWIGYYGFFDGNQPIRFTYMPRNGALLEPFRDAPAVQTLRWFSKGFYVLTQEEETVYMSDLRFGQTQLNGGHFIFSYALTPTGNPADPIRLVNRPPNLRFNRATFGRLWNRILGHNP